MRMVQLFKNQQTSNKIKEEEKMNKYSEFIERMLQICVRAECNYLQCYKMLKDCARDAFKRK